MSKQYFKGKEDEKLFCQITGATPAPNKRDKQHVDCYLDGYSVDVKGLRRSHKSGCVLVEFLNVAGKTGWCHPDSGAQKIAFMFEDCFYVVDTQRLYEMAVNLLQSTKVKRGGKPTAKEGLYQLVGRGEWKGKERKDVFTYITLTDLLDLNPKIYDY